MSNIIKKNSVNKNLKNNSVNKNNNKLKNISNNNQLNKPNKNKIPSQKSNYTQNKNKKINNNKISNIKQNISKPKTANNANNYKNSKHPKKINSLRGDMHPSKTYSAGHKNNNINIIKNKKNEDFDREYEKLNNLCYYKKNYRSNIELQDFIDNQKKRFKQNIIKQKELEFKKNDKLYRNFVNLEKIIKHNNIHKINTCKKKREINDEENMINEKSNGSIDKINLEKNYYFGCLDVKWILSNSNNSSITNNINQ